MKQKITLKKIIAYIQGHLRYKLYYQPRLKWLIRRYIREQIEYRIITMNPMCYEAGQCIECGCMTTALQMANKECEGKCYPPMMVKEMWNQYKQGSRVFMLKDTNELWVIARGITFYKSEEIKTYVPSNTYRPRGVKA